MSAASRPPGFTARAMARAQESPELRVDGAEECVVVDDIELPQAHGAEDRLREEVLQLHAGLPPEGPLEGPLQVLVGGVAGGGGNLEPHRLRGAGPH